MALEQMVKVTFNECFKKYIYDELVVGQLAHTEFKNGEHGDEVDILMPGMASLFDYTGKGDLPKAETLNQSATKIRLDKGKAFHFELNHFEERELKNADSPVKQAGLVKEYGMDAVKQFASAVDEEYASLHARAGIRVDGLNDNETIAVDSTNAREILAYMANQFQRGDKKGHNAWVDGSMLAVFPTEFMFFLTGREDLKYVESGHKKQTKGFVGELAGWKILCTNTIKPIKIGSGQNAKYVFNPLFGIKGKTLAGGISKNLHTESYKPDLNFNTRYKGYGLYGVAAPRADYFGTMPIELALDKTAIQPKA